MKGKTLTTGKIKIIINVFNHFKTEKSLLKRNALVEMTVKATGATATVYPSILKVNACCLMLEISYFVLLLQPLFVPCLFEKVYWEVKCLAESIYSQNCWDAQFVCKKCNSTSSILIRCLLVFIFTNFLFFLKDAFVFVVTHFHHIFLHIARIKLAQRASCLYLTSINILVHRNRESFP